MAPRNDPVFVPDYGPEEIAEIATGSANGPGMSEAPSGVVAQNGETEESSVDKSWTGHLTKG